MIWYEPWYATWLLPLAMACRDRRLAGIAACFTVLVPMLYHPTELYGLAALGSHGVALALFIHPSVQLGLDSPRPRSEREVRTIAAI